MTKQRRRHLLCGVLVIVIGMPVILGGLFPNTTRLVVCLLLQRLPDADHISRIRGDLESQPAFIEMLAAHETTAVERFDAHGHPGHTQKYLHRTPTSMFDVQSFHDIWEVWVRTDVINGAPRTHYLVRLGMIKDVNAGRFFGDQCRSGLCKQTVAFSVAVYNQLFDWDLFKPIRLNITESDATSSIARRRITRSEWEQMVLERYWTPHGRSFTRLGEDVP